MILLLIIDKLLCYYIIKEEKYLIILLRFLYSFNYYVILLQCKYELVYIKSKIVKLGIYNMLNIL